MKKSTGNNLTRGWLVDTLWLMEGLSLLEELVESRFKMDFFLIIVVPNNFYIILFIIIIKIYWTLNFGIMIKLNGKM